jgi:hypothetical protein
MQRGDGTPTWEGIYQLFSRYHRDGWAAFDLRNPNTEFANGLKGVDGGVVVGTTAQIAGRPSSSIPTVLGKVTDGGKAQDQRFLPASAVLSPSSLQDVDPVTASSGATTATVNIASHSVVADFGTVAYNSGAISGLNLNTAYYVYADDPNFAGGAVSYLASTSRTTAVASGSRYFVGSVTTPLAANSASIIGATAANPIVFQTSAVHGWNTGDQAKLAALPGDFGTNLNGNTYTITATDPTHFSITVDGSAYTAYSSGGTATRIVADKTTQAAGAGGGWVDFGGLR